MLNTLVVQGIGGIAYTLLALSYFKKEKRQILFIQIFAYIFFLLHYYLLNGITGAICNLIGLLALSTIYIFEKRTTKNKDTLLGIVVVFFTVLMLVANIVTFQNIFSIFPMVASVIAIVSFLRKSENDIRGIGILVAICWLIYAIVYKSYISIIFEAITLIDVVIAFLKNLQNKKNRKEE